jgi:hypothetical protein
LQAWTLFFQVAAACFVRLLSVRVSVRRLADQLVEVAEDRLLADHYAAAFESERRDRDCAGQLLERDAIGLFDWHLVHDVVDAELGQTLADTAGGWAPLGLVELEHRRTP